MSVRYRIYNGCVIYENSSRIIVSENITCDTITSGASSSQKYTSTSNIYSEFNYLRVIDGLEYQGTDIITSLNNKANISDIPDVSNFITKNVNDLTYYYTKTTTDGLLSNKANISDIPSLANCVDLTSNQSIDGVKTFDNNILYTDNFKNNRCFIINNYFSSTSELTTENYYYLCIYSNGIYSRNHIYKVISLSPLSTQEVLLEDFLLAYVLTDHRYLIYYNNNWVCINEGRFNIGNVKNNSLIFNDYDRNINNGSYCNVFGYNNNLNNNISLYTLVNGSNNEIINSYAQNSLISGHNNKIKAYCNSIILNGYNNMINESMHYAIVSGSSNINSTNTSNSTLLLGTENNINGCSNSLINGHNHNIITVSNSLIIGSSHTSNNTNKNYNAVIGYNHQINNTYCLLAGAGNISSNNYQTILGKYSDNTNSNNLLVVGNGTDNNTRSNALLLNNSGDLVINNLSYSNDYKNNRFLIIDDYFKGNDLTPLITETKYYLCIYTSGSYTKNNIYKITALSPSLTTEEIIPEDFLIINVLSNKFYFIYYNNNWSNLSIGQNKNLEYTLNKGEIFNDYTTNRASGNYSHSEGFGTKATANYSHSEGWGTTASGHYSHSEGDTTTSSGHRSHSEGFTTLASGYASHSEGYKTTASGYASHSGGYNTVADKDYMTSIGKYNIYDENNPSLNDNKLFVVGNGYNEDTRSDAFAVYDNGFIGYVDDTHFYAGLMLLGLNHSGSNHDLMVFGVCYFSDNFKYCHLMYCQFHFHISYTGGSRINFNYLIINNKEYRALDKNVEHLGTGLGSTCCSNYTMDGSLFGLTLAYTGYYYLFFTAYSANNTKHTMFSIGDWSFCLNNCKFERYPYS